MEAQILFKSTMDDSFGVDLITALEESKAVSSDNDFLEDRYSKYIRKSTETIILDVGGTKFYVLKSTFATWPTTR